MNGTRTTPQVDDLLVRFAGADVGSVGRAFQTLVEAIWKDGTVLDESPVATIHAVRSMIGRVAPTRQAPLVILLGLLAESEYPDADGPLVTAVGDGIDDHLALLVDADPVLADALYYLLAHLPAHRDRILAAVAGAAPEDRSRVERALARLEPGVSVIGRVWPSPHQWSLDGEGRSFDRSWIDALPPAALAAAWDGDTRSVLAYMGAKALWGAFRGRHAPVVDTVDEPVVGATATAAPAAPRHDWLRCPACHGELDPTPSSLDCAACGIAHSVIDGVVDLIDSRSVGDVGPDTSDVLQNATGLDGIGRWYESVLRPAFLRVMGGNWGGRVTPAGEDLRLAGAMAGVDGPVLDLAAGAGRWTRTVADVVGHDRVVALDVIPPMLAELHRRLPEVTVVRGTASNLPFGDGSLAGVNLWNALQALPDPVAAVREIGRCLRPGGRLTLMTFLWSRDPLYRYFQHAHRFPGSPDGIELFDQRAVELMLDEAGLVLRSVETQATTLFVVAEKS